MKTGKPKSGKKAAGRTTAARPGRTRARATGTPKKADSRRKLAAPGAGAARLVPHVAAALRRRGEASPAAEVVETIAAVGAGYRLGPAADPPFPTGLDIDKLVADGMVEIYWVGHRSLDRQDQRKTAANWVKINLAQAGPAGVGQAARATLASLGLGAWRPGLDEKTRLKILINLVMGWYRSGLVAG